MDIDDISCWLPDIFSANDISFRKWPCCKCPLTGSVFGKTVPEECVAIKLYKTERYIVAGAAFELFDSCNHYTDPDSILLEPYLSVIAGIEQVETKDLHKRIVAYQINGLRNARGEVSQTWASALALWLNELEQLS